MSDRSAMEEAIRSMQTEAVNFAYRFINDAKVRQNYLTSVQRFSQEMLDGVRGGRLSPREAAEQANAMRNHILEMSRLRSSDIGRATAEGLKAQGLTMEKLLETYAQKLYKRSFSALAEGEKDAVYLAIVEASGRARPSVNLRAARLGRLGKGLFVLSAAIAVYNIATAEDKVDATVREGVGIGGGVLGGMGGGALAGLACGPGAPVCVTIGVFVGGIAGALGADLFYDWAKK